MVDSDVTAIVGRYLSEGSLSIRHVAYLGLRYHDLNYIVPILNEAGAEYFWRLGRLAEMVLRELAKAEPPAT